MILNWILSLATAVLLVLLFPRFSYVWLAPAALAPLLIACARESRWAWRLAYGYVAGVVYWFGLCNWIQWTLEQHAGVGSGMAWFLFALFCLAKAIQMAGFACLAGPMMRRWWGPPAVAALWVAIEWTHSYTGFEWLNLGDAGSDMSGPLRLAPITGVWGLSFAFALIAAVLAVVVLRRPRLASGWLLLFPAMFLLPAPPEPQRGAESALIVQPNMDDETQWTHELLAQEEERLKALSLSPVSAGSEMIVWPEVPAPFYADDPQYGALAAQIATGAHAAFLSGVVGRAPDRAPLNSALLVDARGARVSRYDKVHLVPFGEFVPWPFGALTQKVSAEAGDFERGGGVVVSRMGTKAIGTFICYESVFPGYIRRFASEGAQALFNLSNDSWFGKSAARYQHLLIVRMRAAENRRWIVRATNNGISGAIDPAGRLLQAMPEYREGAAPLRFSYRSDLTVYTRYGDWFVYLCMLGAAAAVMSDVLPARRRL